MQPLRLCCSNSKRISRNEAFPGAQRTLNSATMPKFDRVCRQRGHATDAPAARGVVSGEAQTSAPARFVALRGRLPSSDHPFPTALPQPGSKPPGHLQIFGTAPEAGDVPGIIGETEKPPDTRPSYIAQSVPRSVAPRRIAVHYIAAAALRAQDGAGWPRGRGSCRAGFAPVDARKPPQFGRGCTSRRPPRRPRTKARRARPTNRQLPPVREPSRRSQIEPRPDESAGRSF